MEHFIHQDDIQPGQELDPYTVLRLRQAAFRKAKADEDNQDAESEAGEEKAVVRKGRK